MAPIEPKRVGMNISLTPELARTIQERVESGLYSSASEVVREALRLLVEKDRSSAASTLAGSELPTLEAEDWRELRAALLAGDAELFEERFREIGELFKAGLELTRARLVAERPEASEKEIQKHLAQWLHERAGADFGDGPGVPVSRERLERILRG